MLPLLSHSITYLLEESRGKQMRSAVNPSKQSLSMTTFYNMPHDRFQLTETVKVLPKLFSQKSCAFH